MPSLFHHCNMISYQVQYPHGPHYLLRMNYCLPNSNYRSCKSFCSHKNWIPADTPVTHNPRANGVYKSKPYCFQHLPGSLSSTCLPFAIHIENNFHFLPAPFCIRVLSLVPSPLTLLHFHLYSPTLTEISLVDSRHNNKTSLPLRQKIHL